MFNKINIMVPSYKRPEMLKTLIKSARNTAINPSMLRFTFIFNIRDDSYWGFDMLEDTNVLYESEIEPNLAMYYNMMYTRTKFNAPDTLVSMIGDDMEFKTKGWDKIIIEKANEICGVGIIHCDDGFMQHGNIPVNLFTSREYVDACGSEYMCSKFKRFWIDTIWGEVSTRTDTNYYLPNVLIKHNHTTLKGQYDETYRRLEELAKGESVGGVEQYKNKIWPDVYMRIANLKRSGLI